MGNLETVQSIYEAFGRGDIPAILNTLSDDVQWERPGTGHGVPWLTPGNGKAHVGGFFQSLAGLEITRFEPNTLLTGGDQVCAVIEITLTVKATGHSIEDEELHLWTFGPDGKVAAFRHVADTAVHVAALRAAPASA